MTRRVPTGLRGAKLAPDLIMTGRFGVFRRAILRDSAGNVPTP